MENGETSYRFRTEEFLPRPLYEAITEERVRRGGALARQEAEARLRRQSLTTDGRLTILAADHPARRVTNIAANPMAMADRYEYLGRILRVITSPGFDGVMGPTDIVEDLLMLSGLLRQRIGRGFLDGKVLLGCMNRGGIAGTTFEMDDTMTSFTAASMARLHLDGAKLMFRLCDDDLASLRTIGYCVRAINELNALGLASFLEALAVTRVDGRFKSLNQAEPLARAVSVASALGDSSLSLWLKIPYCPHFHLVTRATTLPILMLGGETSNDPRPLLQRFARGMGTAANVRGVLVGRNVLFPGREDPAAVAGAVSGIVHEGWDLERALHSISERRDAGMTALHTSYEEASLHRR